MLDNQLGKKERVSCIEEDRVEHSSTVAQQPVCILFRLSYFGSFKSRD